MNGTQYKRFGPLSLRIYFFEELRFLMNFCLRGIYYHEEQHSVSSHWAVIIWVKKKTIQDGLADISSKTNLRHWLFVVGPDIAWMSREDKMQFLQQNNRQPQHHNKSTTTFLLRSRHYREVGRCKCISLRPMNCSGQYQSIWYDYTIHDTYWSCQRISYM